MCGLVVSVEAGKKEKQNWNYRQKFPGWCVLQSMVQLLPVGQKSNCT